MEKENAERRMTPSPPFVPLPPDPDRDPDPDSEPNVSKAHDEHSLAQDRTAGRGRDLLPRRREQR